LDTLKDSSEELKFSNRLKLFNYYLSSLNPDIIGLSEVDAMSGTHPEEYHQIILMLESLGYNTEYFEKTTYNSASTISYKRD
jgi:mRNA deadenylase 3'-5' endonuclease subunit Ccr4